MAENFHRITLSITKDMKARLDRFPDENWSALTRAALEGVLAKLERARRNG